MSSTTVPKVGLAVIAVVAIALGGFAVGKGDKEVVREVKTVEVMVPQKSDPKATCMYEAILAYPEYMVIGGEYETNGNKPLLDVVPACKKIAKKDKVKMRVAISNMVSTPLP